MAVTNSQRIQQLQLHKLRTQGVTSAFTGGIIQQTKLPPSVQKQVGSSNAIVPTTSISPTPQPGDPGFVGPIIRDPPQPGDPGFVGPIYRTPTVPFQQPSDPGFVGPILRGPHQPGDPSFVGPISVPGWYRQQVTIPKEIKFLGYEKEYLRYGYETSIGLIKLDDIGFNKKLEEHFKKLEDIKRFEYGIRFGDIGKESVSEWKYYEGGFDYLKTYKEDVVDKFIKEKGGYKKFYQGMDLDPVEVAQKYSTKGGIYGGHKLTSKEFIREYSWDVISKTPSERKEIYFGKLPMPVRIYTSFHHAATGAALFPVTLPQAGVKYVTGEGSLTDPFGRMGTGETLFFPDVSEKVSQAKLGPGGVIGPAISEVWFGQDVSAEKELQKKYPVETVFGTVGEIFGMYVGSKGISTGAKAVKPHFISTIRIAGTKIYTQFPKGWTRAFPKLQPLHKYIYGRVPSHIQFPKTITHGIVSRTTMSPVMTTTGKIKYIAKKITDPFKPKSFQKIGGVYGSTVKGFRTTDQVVGKVFTQTKTAPIYSRGTGPLQAYSYKPTLGKILQRIPTKVKPIELGLRYRSFQLAKTGFKRFTGMERAIGKPFLFEHEPIATKGFGGASKPRHGMFLRTRQWYRKGWGKEYISEKDFLKMGEPEGYWGVRSDYYRPTGKQIVPRVTKHGTYIGETTSDIATSVQKTIRTQYGSRFTGGPAKSFIESRTSGGWLYRPSGTPRTFIFGERFKHFIGAKKSLHIGEDITKGIRYPRSLTEKFNVVARIKTRFGTEYGGMPKFPKGPKYPKLDVFKKTPFPKRSGWGGQVSRSELEAMEEGISTGVHKHWYGVAPSFNKAFYPTTMGADIATGFISSGWFGLGAVGLSNVKTIQEPKFKPDIKTDTFKASTISPRSDIVFKPKEATDVLNATLFKQAQAAISDVTPIQKSIKIQKQAQKEQQKYMPYQPTTTIPQQVYQYKIQKVPPVIPLLPDVSDKKTKKLSGQGYAPYVKDHIYSHGKKKYEERFIRMDKKAYSEKDALALGSYLVDQSAAASFKIKKVSGKPEPLEHNIPSWSIARNKFYHKDKVMIENTSFRIDSPGELQQITAKGIMANLNKPYGNISKTRRKRVKKKQVDSFFIPSMKNFIGEM